MITQVNLNQEIGNLLGHYVYMLIDPRDHVPFYVGKGTGSRFASHGKEAMLARDEDSSSEKLTRINDIRKQSLEPETWIVRYRMSEKEYSEIEASLIDVLLSFPITKTSSARLPLIGASEQLCNLKREHTDTGIVSLDTLIATCSTDPLRTNRPLFIKTLKPWVDLDERIPGGHIRNGYGYKQEWLEPSVRIEHLQEIGESLSGWWKKVSTERLKTVEFAVAAFQGVTRGVYRIVPDSIEVDEETGRKGFQLEVIDSGPIYDEIVGEYGKRIMPKSAQGSQWWPGGFNH